ncbi:MAG: glucosamine-6-phosphate deaminase [Luteococcus sp.]|uniref:glucosamine-6-phosphate deaminase n=1 Tax=Luteococcus sp. TaxID=1969402 RepID=UPI0026477307|nr:glucosamine-6-phosphate deaminase [Luteococcus sp.]MDN5562685.1 glucosamine-6-phosphate deaminase [Luteococcus sp.]
MEIIICPDVDSVGRVAAAKVAQVVADAGPQAVLGVATGSSPLATYEHLAKLVEAGSLDLTQARAFALDEYVGLPEGHPESYAAVVRRTVTEPLRMDPARVQTPDGCAADIAQAAKDYERQIRDAGGVDVQVLGIGGNGHIGFNEPGSSFASRTRIKTLAAATRAANARFFPRADGVPRHCLTQGLGTIMDAREVVLVAQGAQKADAVAAMVEGPVTASCPGSLLQFHEHATIVVDEDAAVHLARADYYRESYRNKPAWQGFEDKL